MGPASETIVSLSQALLAPLDAILKAQVHAARSFLSFLMQLGYPHRPSVPPEGGGAGGSASPAPGGGEDEDGLPYHMEFFHELPNQGRRKLRVPTLALVPLNPLGVKQAEFQFDFHVRRLGHHTQIQASEAEAVSREAEATRGTAAGQMGRTKRPWYLVDTPLSLRGTFAPSQAEGPGVDAGKVDDARFHIEVKVGELPMPAALEKLLVSLGQVTTVEDLASKNE